MLVVSYVGTMGGTEYFFGLLLGLMFFWMWGGSPFTGDIPILFWEVVRFAIGPFTSPVMFHMVVIVEYCFVSSFLLFGRD